MGIQFLSPEEVKHSASCVVNGAFSGKKTKAISTHVTPEAAVLIEAIASFHNLTPSQFIAQLLKNEVRKTHDLTMMFNSGLEQSSISSEKSKPSFSLLH
jgi:hypothetical protein